MLFFTVKNGAYFVSTAPDVVYLVTAESEPLKPTAMILPSEVRAKAPTPSSEPKSVLTKPLFPKLVSRIPEEDHLLGGRLAESRMHW